METKNNMLSLKIGNKIEEFRLINKDRFKTKKQLAEALGVPYIQLYQYIADKVSPGTTVLQQFRILTDVLENDPAKNIMIKD